MNTVPSPSSATQAGWKALFKGRNKLKAIALAIGVMLHATNIYLSTTIMPSVIKEIGGLKYYAWNTTIFVVASVIGSVISAHSLAQQGPRQSYRLAILLFSAGTVICMTAPSMYIMLFGRFVQGFGGGILFALSYAMIRIIFDSSLWSRAMALVSGMWGIAAFSGPFIGGIFAEYNHWRLAFGSLLLISAGLLIITEIILPSKKTAVAATPIPYLKLILLTLAALSVSAGSIMESITANLTGTGIAILLMLLLVIKEREVGTRLLPTGAYRISSSLGITYIIMILLTIATAIEIFVPYFAQTIHGYSPLKSGYLTVLIAFGWTFSSILFSGLKPKTANKIVFTGAILMFIGLTVLSYLSSSLFNSNKIELTITCISLVLIGIGIGMGWPHLLTRVFSLAPKGEEELTSASVTTVQLMATTFGTAIAGLVANAGGMTNPGGIEGAKTAASLLYGFFAFAPLLVVLIMLSQRKK